MVSEGMISESDYVWSDLWCGSEVADGSGGNLLKLMANSDVDIRLQWGYAGGNFYYGGTIAEMTDNFIPEIMDFVSRMTDNREIRPLNPSYVADEEENEQLNLWKTPLIDNVNTWTLQFATGVKSIDTDWETYVSSCEGLNSIVMTNYINEIYNRTK